jgi:hypothetical protein
VEKKMSGFLSYICKLAVFSAFWGFVTNPKDEKMFSWEMFSIWMAIGLVLYVIFALFG